MKPIKERKALPPRAGGYHVDHKKQENKTRARRKVREDTE